MLFNFSPLSTLDSFLVSMFEPEFNEPDFFFELTSSYNKMIQGT